MIDNFIAQVQGIISTDFSNLNNQDGRRALIYSLGNNNNAIVAADILIYLIYQTLATPTNLLKQYDGYIVRTYQQIELETGCSNLINNRTPIRLLKETGLIETNNKSQKRRTCYKVNTEVLIDRLDEAYIQMGIEKERFYEEFNQTTDKIDWEHINELVDGANEDDEKIDKLVSIIGRNRVFDIPMMHYVDKYWKEKFGTDFKWNRGEYNTLSHYLSHKGTHNLSKEEKDKLKEAINTLEEVDWMECKYPAFRIVKRFFGFKKFGRRNSV